MQKAVSLPILLAAASFVASAASAQSLAPVNNVGFAKTEAILGGAPSRLAAIMAAQGSMAPVRSASFTPAFASSRPAASLLLRPAPYVVLRRDPASVSASRPDVFNSVALEVGRTSLDKRWSAVEQSRVGGAAARVATALRGADEYARIEAINAYVNANVGFVDDRVRFGVADRWSAAAQTLASGRGDCEDFAIAKLAMLRAAGFADRNLYLVVLKDLVRRADHAVLVVRSGGRFLVLDNGTDRLIDSVNVTDYRPILTFTAGQTFTHGYRRDAVTTPVHYASVQFPAAPIPTAAAQALAGLTGPAPDPTQALSIASADFPLLPAALMLALRR